MKIKFFLARIRYLKIIWFLRPNWFSLWTRLLWAYKFIYFIYFLFFFVGHSFCQINFCLPFRFPLTHTHTLSPASTVVCLNDRSLHFVYFAFFFFLRFFFSFFFCQVSISREFFFWHFSLFAVVFFFYFPDLIYYFVPA